MARLPMLDREDLVEEEKGVFDRLIASRGAPMGNIWKVLLNSPNLTDRVLQLADELRKGTTIGRNYRELAVLTVGLATDCPYEFEHHCHSALEAGVTPEQMRALSEFETSSAFDAKERTVIRYAFEATKTGKVNDATWNDLHRFFGDREAMEIAMTVAWYNLVVRILLPLEVEFEPGFVPVKR